MIVCARAEDGGIDFFDSIGVVPDEVLVEFGKVGCIRDVLIVECTSTGEDVIVTVAEGFPKGLLPCFNCEGGFFLELAGGCCYQEQDGKTFHD